MKRADYSRLPGSDDDSASTAFSPRAYVKRIPRNWLFAAGGALGTAVFLLIIWNLFGDAPRHHPQFNIDKVSPWQACHDYSLSNAEEDNNIIPNIVHYVWLLKDPSVLAFDFPVFVSVYSAYLFWRPETIYLHTDASESVFEDARVHGDVWTRRVLAIPGLTRNPVVQPTATKYGVPITHFENKADFVRIEAVRDFGGVYIDTDVVPLRDNAPLREAGFAAVLGGNQGSHMVHQGFINNGVLMGKKGALLMHLWLAAVHRFWDGDYGTPIYLLSDLAQRLVPLPSREVLVLQEKAFHPVSWETDGQASLWRPVLDAGDGAVVERPENIFFSVHGKVEGFGDDDGVGGGKGGEEEKEEEGNLCYDVATWLSRIDAKQRTVDSRIIDFSGSYALHAFDSKVRGFDGVKDPKYVWSRKSNYARAVYPAIAHAVDAGVISIEEVMGR